LNGFCSVARSEKKAKSKARPQNRGQGTRNVQGLRPEHPSEIIVYGKCRTGDFGKEAARVYRQGLPLAVT